MLPPRTHPWPENVDMNRQSFPVPGTKRPGQTHHYRSITFGLVGLDHPDGFRTLPEIFDDGYKLSKDKPFLGHRKSLSTDPPKFENHYTWQTYKEVDIRRRCVGSAVHALFKSGVLSGEDGLETVGIWAPNRPEWQIVDLALQAYNKVSVALYDTQSQNSAEYIINHSHLSIVFTEPPKIPLLLNLAPRTPSLKVIVSLDVLPTDMKHVLTLWANERNIQVLELAELEAQGQKNLLVPVTATSETVAIISYTSGTTGTPKGVVLTHGNLASATFSNMHGFGCDNPAVYSFLPLAHIYGRAMDLCAIALGGKIGYSTGSPLRFLEDIQILKPNAVAVVPRLLNKFHQALAAAGNAPGFRGKLFNMAVNAKLEKLHTTGDVTHVFWDRLIFRKVRAIFGGNLEFITCGSAPLSPEVLDFMRIALCCKIAEGYGMTENCGACLRVHYTDPSSTGTVGSPQPVNEVKLIDIPNMGYSSEDKPFPRGELLVRGSNCFTHYYKDEETTKKSFDNEGFVRTGDIAEIDQCGRFKIIDRVKNIMKLAQGEYVALEKVENLHSLCPIVAQFFIYGDSIQSYLVGVLVPDPVHLAALVSSMYRMPVRPEDETTLAEAIKDPKIVAAILDLLRKDAVHHGLQGFEIVKRIHVTMMPFCVEDDTMTPTMKLRRPAAYKKYEAEIDALYALGDPQQSVPVAKL